MAIQYETTITPLAASDLDVVNGNPLDVPTVVVPSGNGWRLQATATSPNVIYYTWVKGSPVVSVSTNYAMLESDEVILVDATAANRTVDLFPTPVVGTTITIKKIDNTANTVTINGNGATIDGQATQVLSSQFSAYKIVYNGSAWFII